MRGRGAKQKITVPVLFSLFFSFLLGVAGGWYVGQKTAGGSPIFPPKEVKVLEPNDTIDKALLVTPGVSFQGTLNTGKDIDFYKLSVDAPSRVRISLAKLPAAYQLYIYNPNRQVIALSQRQGFLDTTSTFAASDKGTYFIKIFTTYSESATLPYAMIVTILPFVE